VQDELHPDEGQDHRQPDGQIHQPAQQASHQEEQRAQAEQRERVGREHDVRLVGDAEHRGDRVQREQHVRAADGDEHDEQRRDHPVPAVAGDEPPVVEPVADRQDPAGDADQGAVGHVGVGVPVRQQSHRRPDQDQAEDQEHERQEFQQHRAHGDEARAQAQRGADPEDEHPLLVLAGDREGRHDDDEDEQVVDRQAQLHDVARGELGGIFPSLQEGEDHGEARRRGGEQPPPQGGLAKADSVRAQRRWHQVNREQRQRDAEQDNPVSHRDVHKPAPRSSPSA
jgi:hypothetical protein